MKNNTRFNGPLSRSTWVSRYKKDKTNLDFSEARHSERQRHQLDHMQICTSLQTDNHASTLPLSFFKGQMPFLLPMSRIKKQKKEITEGKIYSPFGKFAERAK